ncbi:hypothetical protein JOB18_000157 [Solea senegalensis]|uniref:Uncharacterized protein n=1 Tax=Solea senegalensis TaxID=28829 RepID=A0AAV6SEQ9_SOLSE|nr:hypothetical protein JOB18_000157 [Solea senegalensis]
MSWGDFPKGGRFSKAQDSMGTALCFHGDERETLGSGTASRSVSPQQVDKSDIGGNTRRGEKLYVQPRNGSSKGNLAADLHLLDCVVRKSNTDLPERSSNVQHPKV